jgi:hypothetical protein
MGNQKLYSHAQIAAEVGITERTLGTYISKGLIVPKMSYTTIVRPELGVRRRRRCYAYTAIDLEKVREVASTRWVNVVEGLKRYWQGKSVGEKRKSSHVR